MQLDILMQLLRTMTLQQIRQALKELEKHHHEAYLALAHSLDTIKAKAKTE